jgi:hypothetical protein
MPCLIASATPTLECTCALSWSKATLLDSKLLRYLLCAKIFQEITNVLTSSDPLKTIRSPLFYNGIIFKRNYKPTQN